MLNNILKVYDEDLIKGSIAASSISSSKVLAAGSTQGALCINVFADGAVTTLKDVTITVKHCDTENGTFTTLLTMVIDEDNSYTDGTLISTVTLPQDTKAFISATAVSDATNSGKIRVTLGYLAR